MVFLLNFPQIHLFLLTLVANNNIRQDNHPKSKQKMKKNPLLLISLISALVAILVVVVLKFLKHDNPTVVGGGVAGGIAGAIITGLLKRKNE